MKKIVLSIIVIISLFIISGCGNQNDEEEVDNNVKIELNKEKLTIEVGNELTLYSLVKDEYKDILVSENKLVDTTTLGEKDVTIVYNDNGSDKEYTFKINIVDNEAPAIIGVKDLTTTVGREIDLLKDIIVTDNSKEEIKTTIIGDYDFNTAGTYNLKYVAVDSSNNKVEKEFALIVEKIPTLELGKKYYDKNNMYNGKSLNEIILNSDNSVEASSCGKNAGCSNYIGKFTINETTLTIKFLKYQDVTGEWVNLPKTEQKKHNYTITDENTFIDNIGIYVIE